jgi:cytochrome c-type biogenesis protein CcmH
VMSAFVIFCAAMALAAMVAIIYPLLRPVPVTKKGEPVVAKANGVALALALAVPVAAAMLYAGITNYPWSNPAMAEAVPPGHGAGEAASMAEATIALEARLAANPGDAQGWRMLGRTYLVTGEPGKAVTAYEKAVQVLGNNDLGLQLDLAEAIVLGADPAMQPRAVEIVNAALAADGTNQKALWYSGVIAVRANDNETAKTNWQKLLEQDPPAEIRQVIVSQLAALGVTADAVPTPAMAAGPASAGGTMGGGTMGSGGMGGATGGAGATPVGRTIRVAVSVEPALASRLKPGTPLFVSARQPGIPGPPIAAVRLNSDELPTTVTLSDANTMIEGRNLSSVDDVEVVARVAFGGTAMVASGDLIGSSIQKKGGPPDLGIVIAKVQP